MSGTGVGASYGDLLVTSLVVLGAVCIAAFVVVRVVGRLLATGRSRGTHLLDIVARLPLEPRRSLYVIDVAGKTLLVGTSEMGLSVLSELDGVEVRSRAAPRPSFGELVLAAWHRRRGATGAPVAHVREVAGERIDGGGAERTREPARQAREAAGERIDGGAERTREPARHAREVVGERIDGGGAERTREPARHAREAAGERIDEAGGERTREPARHVREVVGERIDEAGAVGGDERARDRARGVDDAPGGGR